MVIIQLSNIKKSYNGHLLFENFSCSIEHGEVVAIMGKSGSGKTTLLNMIGCLDKPDSGSIIIDDIKDPWKSGKDKANIFRYKLGYLFQNYALIDNETVSKNLDIALEYIKKDKKEKEELKIEALKKVGLIDKMKCKVYQLSGGEQQRIALARLFLKESKIILADEPTGSLDIENRDKVLSLLKELNNLGKTVLIVTHDNYIGDFCDRIIKI